MPLLRQIRMEEQMYEAFEGMTDDAVAMLAQQGDADASAYLLNKYKNFVRSKINLKHIWLIKHSLIKY